MLFLAKYSLIDKFMWFEKNKMYFLVNYSPNRGYFHLVKHSPSSTISLLVKSNRETEGEKVRKNERESELKIGEREKQADSLTCSRDSSF